MNAWSPDRRQLILSAAGLSALGLSSLALTARAAPLVRASRPSRAKSEDRVLVILQLYGGNDGFNTLVRFDDDDYHRARPRLALAKKDTLVLDERHGLHPSLAQVREWWDRGNVAIVDGVGSDRTSLSHFRSDAVWEAGGEERARRTGWLGRLMDQRIERGLDVASPVSMMAIGRDVLPQSLRSERVVAPAIPDLASFVRVRAPSPLDAVPLMNTLPVRNAVPSMNATPVPDGTAPAEQLLADCETTLRSALDARAKLADAARAHALVDHPGTEVGRTVESVAKVLRAGLGTRIVYATMASFDTHATQRDDHARLLHELDEGLNALMWDLHAQGALERTLIVTISEFGRRLAENGIGAEAGTDHGRSSVLFALGGAIEPGLFGAPPSFADLDADGNVRATVDFRRVYASVIERWLGCDSGPILGAEFEPVPFVRST